MTQSLYRAGFWIRTLAMLIDLMAIWPSLADRWRLILRWSAKQFWLFAMLLFILTSVPLFYVLSGFMSLIVIIECLFASNDDKLAWHDQWAGTAVYRRARLGSAAPPVTPPAAPPHVA